MWELKGLPYWGKRATYNGGGFVAELPLSQLKMKRFLNKLKEARSVWLFPFIFEDTDLNLVSVSRGECTGWMGII